jgi:hypothetical protein
METKSGSRARDIRHKNEELAVAAEHRGGTRERILDVGNVFQRVIEDEGIDLAEVLQGHTSTTAMKIEACFSAEIDGALIQIEAGGLHALASQLGHQYAGVATNIDNSVSVGVIRNQSCGFNDTPVWLGIKVLFLAGRGASSSSNGRATGAAH